MILMMHSKINEELSGIFDTVGKEPAVFLLGENMVYIRAAPSGAIFYAVIGFETERKDKKI